VVCVAIPGPRTERAAQLESTSAFPPSVWRATSANPRALDALSGRYSNDKSSAGRRRANAGILRQTVGNDLADAVAETSPCNLAGASTLSRPHPRVMTRARRGSIILLAHRGNNGNHGQAAYAARRPGYSASCGRRPRELAPLGIRVNAVAPGMIDKTCSAACRAWLEDVSPGSASAGSGLPEESPR